MRNECPKWFLCHVALKRGGNRQCLNVWLKLCRVWAPGYSIFLSQTEKDKRMKFAPERLEVYVDCDHMSVCDSNRWLNTPGAREVRWLHDNARAYKSVAGTTDLKFCNMRPIAQILHHVVRGTLWDAMSTCSRFSHFPVYEQFTQRDTEKCLYRPDKTPEESE